MAKTTVSQLTTEVAHLLEPLDTALSNPAQAKAFLAQLGWELPPGIQDIGLTGLSVSNLVNKALVLARSTDAEWDDEMVIIGRVADVATEIGRAIAAIKQVMD